MLLKSFERKNAVIVTQMPSQSTAEAFWSMIYDNRCHTIIMLNEHDKNDTVIIRFHNHQKHLKLFLIWIVMI